MEKREEGEEVGEWAETCSVAKQSGESVGVLYSMHITYRCDCIDECKCKFADR